MSINSEKQQIIDTKGNILVTANPGTGKTLLLAHKYLSLIKSGIKHEDILCLTFTEKAKREMEDRIIKLIEQDGIELDTSDLNVFTFHSYALNSIENKEIVTSNLLRFSIYLFIKKNKFLNYTDSHILNNLVPKIENLIRYLKSFGITPEDIDINESKKFLVEDKFATLSEMGLFLKNFVEIYKYYESIKSERGYDYADLLIEFTRLKDKRKYEYVLIDELQDVNKMEADIALESAKNFIAVGDKKQAIFGFQGGSILNFESFGNSSEFVLSDNFRSTNEILSYSREYFIDKTKDQSIIDDLKNLKNAEGFSGVTTKVIEVEKSNLFNAVKILLEKLSINDEKTAVILRTNDQILKLSNELESDGISFTSTHLSGSSHAKEDIISFLNGLLSNDPNIIKNSMFSSYFPITIQQAFELSNYKFENSKEILDKCNDFKALRNKAKNKKEVLDLFKSRIIPISLTYGKDYFITAKKLMDSFIESFSVIEDITLQNIIDYLKATDLNTDEIEEESENVVLTTVHKSKGREYDNVIYIPTQTRDRTNFIDNVVKAILLTKGINAEEELEEETLRVNFVAFTRAKNKLFVLSEKSKDYLTKSSDTKNMEELSSNETQEIKESQHKAFNLFLSGNYNMAKEILETKDLWLVDFIQNHFENLDRLSFSSAKDKPFDYLQDNILKIRDYSPAMKLGSEVHLAAEKIVKEEKYEFPDEVIPFARNISSICSEIKESYPEVFSLEENFNINLGNISEDNFNINFSGKIDAVFKNNEDYLIVDWKTDKDTSKSSMHRQQLECYKRSFCIKNNIPEDNVKVGIAFIGLRSPINTNNYRQLLDDSQPRSSAFKTFLKRVNKIMEWKNNPRLFLEELLNENQNINSHLWRSVVEQYIFEKSEPI